jgi:hypothetical protein
MVQDDGVTEAWNDPRNPLPQRRPIAGAFDFMVRGWRPFGGWVLGLILLVNGVAVPAAALVRGEAPDLDWPWLLAALGLLGLSRDRRIEKSEGVTS